MMKETTMRGLTTIFALLFSVLLICSVNADGTLLSAISSEDMDHLLKYNTGIVFIENDESNLHQEMLDLLERYSAEKNIIIHTISRNDISDYVASKVRKYIEKKNTLFANVSGSEELFNEIVSDSENPGNVIVFINKGNIVGCHLGLLDDYTDPYSELSDDKYELLIDIFSEYYSVLGTSPCPERC